MNILFGIVSGLDKDLFNISILSLSPEGPDSMLQGFKSINCEIIQLNHSRLIGLFKNRKKVASLIKERKIDLVHSHGIRADLINSVLSNVQRFTTIHNIPDEDYKFRYGTIMGYFLASKHKRIFKKIPNTICCSHNLLDRILPNDETDMQFIQNGIHTSRFSPVSSLEEKKRLRKKLRLPQNQNIFVVCGAISYLKNPMLILEVFKSKLMEDSLLVFLGGGELLDKLSSENSNHNIHFQGRTDRVSDYLKACDFYISASFTEGMPNSVLEAISSETPVVLSNIPAHREIVGENYSYLFDPKNEQELWHKLQSILQNYNNEIGKQLKQRVKENFSVESMSHSYQELYLNAMRRDKLTAQ
ncbi:glycosyltransferase family 4 protein [Lutimonas zeaxanthinifaciens]|uniref:glycosyltransferase family 4 protein n=1 Tax=Lutimonas zeaxanthinifaciens TaxID=3060215 RepID=UPI00265CC692|nr:glycosyltransferase family 4 protein [Lutimonas sp. YSD2104]WKK66707.1 glycosyltransferase family 4 protein [Lutimonas sp. YSD2104]